MICLNISGLKKKKFMDELFCYDVFVMIMGGIFMLIYVVIYHKH